MEIKTKETIITQKIYVAKDGQEFHNEFACKKYELLLDLQNKKWFKSKIEKDKNGRNYSILDFDDFYCLEFYWLNNEEDFSELLLYSSVYGKMNTYKGPGWYVVVADRNDDWMDIVRVEYLSDYLQEYKDNLDKWTNGILELVQSKEIKET